VKKLFFIGFVILLFTGCTQQTINVTHQQLPEAVEGSYKTQISVFPLNNYTDIPGAGMRASNIVGGILKANGYYVISHPNKLTFKQMQNIASKYHSQYFLYGGVSEWRYKTGIDGDPAVSLQLTLYATKTLKIMWSSTGSISNWGNDSLGTSAQELINNMIDAHGIF